MNKIIVTGGAGFIGSHTVAELVAEGYIPVIIDNFSNSDERVIAGLATITGTEPVLYRADSCDVDALRKIFHDEKPAGVIHFAAYKAVHESVADPLRYYRNNLLSLVALMEVMNETGVRDLVFSSSCTVYGEPDVNPVTEQSPFKQAVSPYGYSKQVCEQIIRDAHRASNHLSASILRYFNPVGAHPTGLIGELPFGTPNNLVPYITQTAAGIRKQLTVFGNDYNTPDGTCIRDYIHVVDLAKAHVKALQWLEKNAGACGYFNIGQGRGDSVLDVIKAFEKCTGLSLNYSIGPRRPGDVERVWADVSKAGNVLGWSTQLTLQDAMRDAWNWQLQLSNMT
ncbi:MAG: UDP-glucose 4-epimerase GalE [Flavobacteriales bacterium]